MSKNLRDFISENRKAFDDEKPSGNVWEKIEEAVRQQKKDTPSPVRKMLRWSVAAAVVLIVALGIFYFTNSKSGDDQNIVKKDLPDSKISVPNDIGRIDPSYAAEAKKIYQSIERRQNELKVVAADQPELYSQFSQDLATLDSAYRVLKAQAVQTPNREVIIRAMMQNLQLQAELLARQLNILNEIQNDKPDQHEKINHSRL
jgi:hypothetical protein